VKKGRYYTRAGCLYSAFTLIELLVVIAIIALLLAILIPSLNKAQEQVRTVVCRTHLKGIGTAILVYLDAFEGRAYNSGPANGYQWYTTSGSYLNADDGHAYWGVAYKDYAENPAVFGCVSYVKVAELLYTDADPKLAKQAGYALNSFFFHEPKGSSSTDTYHYNRKVGAVRAHHQFIVAQDHVEPKVEGDSNTGEEQNDMMYIPQGKSINLAQYRPGGDRERFYWGIFRHSKRSRTADEPAEVAKRINDMDRNPNGLSNTLWLDGHADAIRETIGTNIYHSWYAGQE
jgi:prepilin-type N-terminal cleavage/methylation domain-containing protein/prepilin-type processing-associated H-X9-DG protein